MIWWTIKVTAQECDGRWLNCIALWEDRLWLLGLVHFRQQLSSRNTAWKTTAVSCSAVLFSLGLCVVWHLEMMDGCFTCSLFMTTQVWGSVEHCTVLCEAKNKRSPTFSKLLLTQDSREGGGLVVEASNKIQGITCTFYLQSKCYILVLILKWN